MGLIRLGKEVGGTPELGRSGRESSVPGRCSRVYSLCYRRRGEGATHAGSGVLRRQYVHGFLAHRSAVAPCISRFERWWCRLLDSGSGTLQVKHARPIPTDRLNSCASHPDLGSMAGSQVDEAPSSWRVDVRELAASESGISHLQGAGVGN